MFSAARALLVTTCLLAATAVAAAPAADAPGSADARLRALYEREWAWRQAEGLRGGRGADDAGADHLPHVDAATQAAHLAYWRQALAELDAIPEAQLSAEEKINAAVFRRTVQTFADDTRFKTYEAPFNADTFFWANLAPRSGGFHSVKAYQNYIARLRDVPRYFDEQIANMRAGLKRGYSVPRVVVTGRDKTIEPYVATDRSNPFYVPFDAMPAGIPADQQAALKAQGDAAIREAVIPAYAKLLSFIRDVYMKQARTTLAAEAEPDGKAYYQAEIEGFTTLKLTAEQIHAIGLKEVARISAEMEATKAQTGFKGDMPAFLTFLRTDPQFYPKTPRELLGFSSYVAKRVDGKLADTIGFLPRRRFSIIPVPPSLAPIYTGGRGGLESCMMNTYDLPSRPLYTLTALTLHECNPGHAFQAAVAQEAQRRPAFRRAAGFSGYGEGWALYMEWLGTKMGMYDTPYENFGRLSYEIWRASRLVIDTGIHHYGWTREQAQQYLRDHTALSEHEIETEVDRYIAWPGQALAYKLGEMLIRQKRTEAETKLGPKFDQRNFHDAILSLGSVPLTVLGARLDQFIADGGVNPPGWNPALPEFEKDATP
ncbi:DUF885 domain-containing protein [Sphingomonas nostoxanthinifaciens]|uniref:DUF885 domain-containing protein n=1 Tax=Sphingomonas nostoxanthinifaciens TaxID=2872652 RepID=UPI001CC20272|nr:DUF885 family protein [Sphingomonas nostoxanthinifaciens]UAK26497.1 DUF885 family protein [Sphingomonas nostoxanthinifaciens]